MPRCILSSVDYPEFWLRESVLQLEKTWRIQIAWIQLLGLTVMTMRILIAEIYYVPSTGIIPLNTLSLNFFFTISLNFKQKAYKSGPQHFWHQGPVSWKTIFLWTRVLAGWFQDDSSPLHSLCTLLLLLLYQLHLRSSGIRSWRLGTPIFITR